MTRWRKVLHGLVGEVQHTRRLQISVQVHFVYQGSGFLSILSIELQSKKIRQWRADNSPSLFSFQSRNEEKWKGKREINLKFRFFGFDPQGRKWNEKKNEKGIANSFSISLKCIGSRWKVEQKQKPYVQGERILKFLRLAVMSTGSCVKSYIHFLY